MPFFDGWQRRVERVGTCLRCGLTDVPVGAGDRLLAHWYSVGDGKYRTSCYWAGRKALDVRAVEA